jgi:molybdopterin-guanine dinucleotide biosynthesis protein A
LAGWLAGLEHCETPYLLTVPCDTPNFPLDLATRLAQALQAEDADVAMAASLEDGRVQVQPVFCLLKSSLIDSLVAYLESGQRKIDKWTGQQRCATMVFEDEAAFFNANTAEDLRSLAGKS